MLPVDTKYFVLTCSSPKSGNKKISSMLAEKLISIGIAKAGSLQDISHQFSLPLQSQRRMIFINDCRSGCVRMIANRFNNDNYLYLDISSHAGDTSFDLDSFIEQHVLPSINSKWDQA